MWYCHDVTLELPAFFFPILMSEQWIIHLFRFHYFSALVNVTRWVEMMSRHASLKRPFFFIHDKTVYYKKYKE